MGHAGKCTKRMPVDWRGQGRNKRPIMGYCPCIGYTTGEEQ